MDTFKDFKLACISGGWQAANNMIWPLEFLDAVVRVKVTLRNNWP